MQIQSAVCLIVRMDVDIHNADGLNPNLELEMNIASLPCIDRPPLHAMPALQSARDRIGLLERLAAWADRQPQHRRLGSWTALGICKRP